MILTARKLAVASPRRPRQSELKRSVSTAYYALFHAVAREAADLLVGVGPIRAGKAWSHAYRGLEHGFAKNACREVSKLGLPNGIQHCASAFMMLQEARHNADYDPRTKITRAEALQWVARAEAAIARPAECAASRPKGLCHSGAAEKAALSREAAGNRQ